MNQILFTVAPLLNLNYHDVYGAKGRNYNLKMKIK